MSNARKRNELQQRAARTRTAAPVEQTTPAPVALVNDTSDETQQTSETSVEQTSDETSASASSDETRQSAPAPVVLNDEQRATLATLDARLATLDALLADMRETRDMLRTLRTSVSGEAAPVTRTRKSKSSDASDASSATRVVKTPEQRKAERLDYRFARRYAKSKGISIDDARKLLAEGKIRRGETSEKDKLAGLPDEIRARVEQQIAKELALLAQQRSETSEQSSDDAAALAAAVDARLACEQSSETSDSASVASV